MHYTGSSAVDDPPAETISMSDLRDMFAAFKNDMMAAVDSKLDAREEAGPLRRSPSQMVAPLRGARTGQSGGRATVGQGEAGGQLAGGAATSAHARQGGRMETTPGGPAATAGDTRWDPAPDSSVIRALKGIPVAPKFDGKAESFRVWTRSFLGFARQHGFVEAFDLEVPIQEISYDEEVSSAFTPHELKVAERRWNSLKDKEREMGSDRNKFDIGANFLVTSCAIARRRSFRRQRSSRNLPRVVSRRVLL